MSKKLMFLVSLVLISAFVMSSCATPTPETIIQTVEVEKEVQVVETVEVEVEKEVTVIETVEVEVEVEVEVPQEPVNIRLWTKEGEADGGLQFVESLTSAFTTANPNVTFEVTNKDVETLREDFQTTSLAGDPPELLWTVNDHAGPFTAAELILPLEDLFDFSKLVPSVEMDGHTWAVPITSGNHLMLLYNKDLVPEPPATSDEWITMGLALTSGDTYGLAFNQTEPFWLVGFLGGHGGAVFEADGVTPSLDTPEMVATLQFLYDIKYTTPIVPIESDYDISDTLFKEGKAAMIINGDWSLGGYSAEDALGDKLGVAPIPMISSTGMWPAPYTSGTYFMVPESLEGAKLQAVVAFINFVTAEGNQLRLITEMKRLPALLSALDNPLISEDPILAGSAAQMSKGTPMPSVLEMRCNWDAMKPELQAVLADTKTPEDAAAAMQAAAVLCIEDL
jgi:arabinogalactan oligomer/maltooligosaccharide transport system substrate-binding protein